MKFGIVGCGLVGKKRAMALSGHAVTWVFDTDPEKSAAVAALVGGARSARDPREIFEQKDVDAVVIATPHHKLAELSVEALNAGKHVLVEKPAARSTRELEAVICAARAAGRVVKVGFNHRFHPAIARAKSYLDSGAAGSVMFIRGRYGHGGRIGYEKEWRAKPELSGGGETIDQGIHLIDLARWMLGDFVELSGYAPTFFWNMPVEDNCFMLLRARTGACAFLHASWTEWKNMFSLEIYGRVAKLHVEGLGGSYGMEKLTVFAMRPEMGPPNTECFEYPGEDISWTEEVRNFISAIEHSTPVCGGLQDALEALRIVEKIRVHRCRIGIDLLSE